MRYLICLRTDFSNQGQSASRWQVVSNGEGILVVVGQEIVGCSVGVRFQSIGLFSVYVGAYQGVLGSTPSS